MALKILSENTDEIIAISVVGAATGCACYLTYLTGEIPEFFAIMAGIIVGHYFRKKGATEE